MAISKQAKIAIGAVLAVIVVTVIVLAVVLTKHDASHSVGAWSTGGTPATVTLTKTSMFELTDDQTIVNTYKTGKFSGTIDQYDKADVLMATGVMSASTATPPVTTIVWTAATPAYTGAAQAEIASGTWTLNASS